MKSDQRKQRLLATAESTRLSMVLENCFLLENCQSHREGRFRRCRLGSVPQITVLSDLGTIRFTEL